MKKPGHLYVYILTKEKNGILFIGLTNNLTQRIIDHKFGAIEGLAKKYDLKTCVYYECYEDINVAMEREKELKWWNKEQRIELIESVNPEWNDLKEEVKKLT